MYERRHLFDGKINEKNVNDFRNLNYQKTKLKERKKEIEDILKNDNDFFNSYFDNFYKDNASTSDELSEKNNVCKVLEGFANYLLGSEEVRQERKEAKTKYKFYVDETEFRLRTKKEMPMTNLTYDSESSNIEIVDNVIHFLKQSKDNFKKEKTLSIKKTDLVDNSYCSEILKQYEILHRFLTQEIKNPNKIKGKRQKLTSMKKDVMDDMLYTKEHLQGIFGKDLRNLAPCSNQPDWDELDYTNVLHMKKLIYIVSDFNPNSELSYFLMDLQTLFNKCVELNVLSQNEIKIYKLIRQGYKNVEIAHNLNVDRYVVTRKVNTLVKKMCKTAENLDW